MSAIDPRTPEAADFAASILDGAALTLACEEAANEVARLADQWRTDAAALRRAAVILEDHRPHSRACGPRRHDHGPDCHPNCQTCGGKR